MRDRPLVAIARFSDLSGEHAPFADGVAEDLERTLDPGACRDGWDKVLALNVKAIFHLTRACLPMLRAAATPADPARVINIGSIDGLRVPVLETYAYSASKAAVHHMTRVLAHKLARQHITVNAVAPGPFESKMMAETLRRAGDGFAKTIPLGRIGRPDDMAGIAIFLSSRAGAYLTGTVIPVDGGISTRHA